MGWREGNKMKTLIFLHNCPMGYFLCIVRTWIRQSYVDDMLKKR